MSPAQEIEAAAATWLARREEPQWSQGDEAQLQSWLDQSYAHKAAYWRLECGWRAADRMRALGPELGSAEHPGRSASSRWQSFAIAASLAGLALLIPAMMHFSSSSPAPVSAFQTPVGGHSRVALADGSTVELNTASAIRTSVSQKQRDVWLDKGEAFFSVRHMGVPFVVHAGPQLVTVLGTKFSVMRNGERVRVAVIEGRVRVSDADASETSSTATITRGDILEAEGSSTLVVQDAENRVERTLAWRDGMLQFDSTPLSDAVAEFNRYNAHKMSVSGRAGTIPIGGSFRPSNVSAFARLLHDAYGLQVEETSTQTKISG